VRRLTEHLGVQDVDDNTAEVVQVSGEDDGLGAKTCASDLGDEAVADGADGKIVETGEHDEESPDLTRSA
jgi:uncharacterized NAD-dependent epimerase/dehydratase family protein